MLFRHRLTEKYRRAVAVADAMEREVQHLATQLVRAQRVNADLTAMLAGRDADVARLQREVDDMVVGLLGRVQRIRLTQAAAARDVRGRFRNIAAASGDRVS